MQRRTLYLVLPLLALAACDDRAINPEHGPLTWTPEGVNNQNIAAMVANPADLAQGHGDAGSDGQQMAAVIHHWRTQTPPNFAPNGASASGASGGGSGGGGSGSGSDNSGASSGGTP